VLKNLKNLEEDKMRKLLSVMALFVISLLMVSAVSAESVAESRSWENVNKVISALDFTTIEVDGDVVFDASHPWTVTVPAVEEGETLEVKVGLRAYADIEDVDVEVEIRGYEYSDYESLRASTHVFDMVEGTTDDVTLEVTLPRQLEKKVYLLRISVANDNSRALMEDIELYVKPARHAVDIKDVSFSPGETVQAGRSLLANVLVQNYGDRDEDDVKVTVAIPALGVSATKMVDVETTSDHDVNNERVPQMFLPIPADAVAGPYNVVVSVQYDDLREKVSKTYPITVVSDARFSSSSDTTVLAAGPEVQSVVAGQTVTYGLALSNSDRSSKAFVLESATGDWASATLSESLVVLGPGQSKVVYLEVTPNAGATLGEHGVAVAVKTGSGDVLDTVSLRANVVAGNTVTGAGFNLRNGLEIALIVLVVLLVVIGLIIGFSRLRRDEDEEDKTYY
jgi:uncharacterized membrane protein